MEVQVTDGAIPENKTRGFTVYIPEKFRQVLLTGIHFVIYSLRGILRCSRPKYDNTEYKAESEGSRNQGAPERSFAHPVHNKFVVYGGNFYK